MTPNPLSSEIVVLYDDVVLYEGDARNLSMVKDDSVHCVITSPPYYNLRDYKSKDQIGLEASIDAYVEELLEVGHQLWRVMRDDGVLWLNLGDTLDGKNLLNIPHRVLMAMQKVGWTCRSAAPWMKRKHLPSSSTDRINVSHEMMFMLVKSSSPLFWTHPVLNGVRTEPEPDWAWKHSTTREIVTENPKDDTGLVWKRFNQWRPHDYYYDRHAVLRPLSEQTLPRLMRGIGRANKWFDPDDVKGMHSFLRPRDTSDGTEGMALQSYSGRNWRTVDVWEASVRDTAAFYRAYADYLEACLDGQGMLFDMEGDYAAALVNPKGYKGTHYATFPRALVRDPIAATAPQQVCEHCGAPWFRVVEEANAPLIEEYHGEAQGDYVGHLAQDPSETKRSILQSISKVPLREHLSPTCECEGNCGSMKSTVLDPFMGSGTVGVECVVSERKFLGVDLSKEYVNDARERILSEAYGFTDTLKGTPYREQIIPGL